MSELEGKSERCEKRVLRSALTRGVVISVSVSVAMFDIYSLY